jgi:hypothetical protein
MIEKVVSWAIQKTVEEETGDSVTTAALLGAGLDSAAFTAIGVPGKAAVAAGAVTGAGLHVCKKIREGKKQ